MFEGSKFPLGFTLGSKFDTSSVETMQSMFKKCAFSDGFELGEKFITGNVRCMKDMFEDCMICDDFYLNKRFNISIVNREEINSYNMVSGMFSGCSDSLGLIDGGHKLDSVDVIDRLKDKRIDVLRKRSVQTANVVNMEKRLIHYEGELGVFDYDPNEFDIAYTTRECMEYLRYCGTGSSVDLPDGCISTRYMFARQKLRFGFTLGDGFNTSKVKDMHSMFEKCLLREGFSLGKNFDTSNVTDMGAMFYRCKFFSDFSLGDKFDTSNVKNMSGMFNLCTLPTGFTLGRLFNTFKVEDMRSMFAHAQIEDGFNLGEEFDTRNVQKMNGIFYGANLPASFYFGGKFKVDRGFYNSIFCSCMYDNKDINEYAKSNNDVTIVRRINRKHGIHSIFNW